MVKENKTPVLIKVISVLYYIGAGLAFLGGLILILGSGFWSTIFASSQPELATIGAGVFIFLGVLFLLWGTLNVFVGRGLWKLQTWARIVVIIFSIFGVLIGLISIISGNFGEIISLGINGLVGWYLLFHEEVKKAFN